MSEAPTFIACGARSGSTVLRWIIDAHPEVACPGETDLALLLASYVRTANALRGEHAGPGSLQQARGVAEELIDAHLAGAGKARWCDKSLSNALHLDLLASAWPKARFILLHRHCMDFVISAIEASPWGLTDYGFSQSAAMSPTNTVVALITHWMDRTLRMLAFEQSHPDRCLRLRYEDLVTASDEVLPRVWDLIGVSPFEGAAKAAFGDHHGAYGPADYKVWYTAALHTDSIGRGARVPPEHVLEPLRGRVNELLAALGYSTYGSDWGSGGGLPAPTDTARAGETTRAESLVELRLVEGHTPLWHGLVDLSNATVTAAIAASEGAAEGGPEPGGRPSRVIAVERSALAGLCSGSESIGAALRARTVRHYGPTLRHFEDERALFGPLAAFLATEGRRLFRPWAGLLPAGDPGKRPAS